MNTQRLASTMNVCGLSSTPTRRGSSLGCSSSNISGKSLHHVSRNVSVRSDRRTTETDTSERNWFEETRQAASQTRRPKSEYVDRSDLYTDNWDGDTYKGSGVNILTVLIGLSLGVPVIGLVIAYFTWGEYWG